MLVREAAQKNTDFLLSSWLGIVLFYFVSVRTSPGSEGALLWDPGGLREGVSLAAFAYAFEAT